MSFLIPNRSDVIYTELSKKNTPKSVQNVLFVIVSKCVDETKLVLFHI